VLGKYTMIAGNIKGSSELDCHEFKVRPFSVVVFLLAGILASLDRLPLWP
jgi:hypothetical protein